MVTKRYIFKFLLAALLVAQCPALYATCGAIFPGSLFQILRDEIPAEHPLLKIWGLRKPTDNDYEVHGAFENWRMVVRRHEVLLVIDEAELNTWSAEQKAHFISEVCARAQSLAPNLKNRGCRMQVRRQSLGRGARSVHLSSPLYSIDILLPNNEHAIDVLQGMPEILKLIAALPASASG